MLPSGNLRLLGLNMTLCLLTNGTWDVMKILILKLQGTKIDDYLKVLNDDYRVERLEAIRDVFVEVLPSKVFSDWMKKKGKEGGANKFPRVLKKTLHSEWKAYLQEYHQINEPK